MSCVFGVHVAHGHGPRFVARQFSIVSIRYVSLRFHGHAMGIPGRAVVKGVRSQTGMFQVQALFVLIRGCTALTVCGRILGSTPHNGNAPLTCPPWRDKSSPALSRNVRVQSRSSRRTRTRTRTRVRASICLVWARGLAPMSRPPVRSGLRQARLG